MKCSILRVVLLRLPCNSDASEVLIKRNVGGYWSSSHKFPLRMYPSRHTHFAMAMFCFQLVIHMWLQLPLFILQGWATAKKNDQKWTQIFT